MPRRRISIRVEHTEVTISITESSGPNQGSVGADGIAPTPPKFCPDCGAHWLPNFRDAVTTLSLTAEKLQMAASEGKLHLLCSPDNQVWICDRSLQYMKEKI